MSGLKPPIKGEVRNPKGVNGFSSFAVLAQKAIKDDDLQAILEKVKEMSKSGQIDAVKFLFERIYGKVPDNMNVKHDVTIEDVRDKLITRAKAKE